MKATRITITVALLGLTLLSGQRPARAVSVVDPDLFAHGTELTNAFPGVTISAVGVASHWKPYAATNPIASTSPNLFGNNWHNLGDPEWGFASSWQPVLRVDFARRIAWVSIDAIGEDRIEDYARLEAYDAYGGLVGAYDTGRLLQGDVEPMFVLSPDPGGNIKYILAGGRHFGVTDHTSALDNLRFAPGVPEPSTLLLLSSGIPGLLLWRRRRSRTA